MTYCYGLALHELRILINNIHNVINLPPTFTSLSQIQWILKQLDFVIKK